MAENDVYKNLREFTAPRQYFYLECCIYNGIVYQCTNTQGTGGRFIEDDWSPTAQYNEINNILLDLKLTDTLQRYKELTYTDGNLTELNIWDSPSKLVQYYSISYIYTLGNLTQITTIRTSDSFTYVKDLAYDSDGNLLNINITI